MNRVKIPFLLLLSLALLAGAPFSAMAGVNPASPGLPPAKYGTGATNSTWNNQFSAMCVDCHTRNPLSNLTSNGTHFVSNGPLAAAKTNSGGGWGTAGTNSQAGVRTNGAYFRLDGWASGAVSKYGGNADNLSYATDNAAGKGARTATVDNNATNFGNREIICESCHNIVVNSAGGNNLPMPAVAQSASASEDPAATVVPNVCVGCHGDMYSVSATNTAVNATKYGSVTGAARNLNQVAGSGNTTSNAIHTIAGTPYNMNHHVTTGDYVNSTLVAAGLAWRDTTVIDVQLTPVTNTVRAGAQMPSRANWSLPMVKPSIAVSCLNCHAPGHGGNVGTGASILRGLDNEALRSTSPGALDRLSDTGRAWFDFNDALYCYKCHELGAAR